MPRNIEIKAKVRDVDRLSKLVFKLTDSLGQTLVQEDTFFYVPNGRLKLRVIDEQPHGELIFYDRPDTDGPKLSVYQRADVDDAAQIKRTLTKALGTRGVVRKIRHLYMYERTRIHVDMVQGLGTYVELEVVLADDERIEEGQKVAEELMKLLDVPASALESGAYVDLLALHNNNDAAHVSPAPAVTADGAQVVNGLLRKSNEC